MTGAVSLLRAVLDACVIFRAARRDTLLSAAEEGLYEVRWSDTILSEACRNLVESGTMNAQQAQRLLARMRQFFPDATVTRFEHHYPEMTNARKDRHVLAAAVAAEAKVIVTSNLQDFPEPALAPLRIEALSPDLLLMILFTSSSHWGAIFKREPDAPDTGRPTRRRSHSPSADLIVQVGPGGPGSRACRRPEPHWLA